MNDIIEKNLDVKENTFMYFLHEKNIFDETLFQEYIKNVGLINTENTQKEKVIAIIEVNDYIIRNIIYHFLPEDLFVIKNFPSNMGEYIEQIRIENERLLRVL
ncbi:MAG: hypothetical protein ACK5LC_09220 [Coprobacillaceae bacterium]